MLSCDDCGLAYPPRHARCPFCHRHEDGTGVSIDGVWWPGWTAAARDLNSTTSTLRRYANSHHNLAAHVAHRIATAVRDIRENGWPTGGMLEGGYVL